MKFKDYFNSVISEMIERYNDPEGDLIVAHLGNVWRLPSDSTDKKILDDISKHTGLPEVDEAYDFYNLIENENRLDIFIGTVGEDNYLHSGLPHSESHTISSPLIRKILHLYKFFGFKERDFGDVDSSVETHRFDVKGDFLDYAYHGTDSYSMLKILKFGLKPLNGSQSTWDFQFSDKIFLTTRLHFAMFHANRSAKHRHAKPIVLKVRIPDKKLIVADYDIAKLFGMEKDAREEGYLDTIQYYNPFFPQDASVIKKYSPKTNFTKSSGVFAYKGRIPVSFIEELIFKNMDDEMLSLENSTTITDKTKYKDVIDQLHDHDFYDEDYDLNYGDYNDDEETED